MPGLLEPLRVVVPSRSLRLHLMSAIIAEFGRPVFGLRVQTLHSVMQEVLDRAGQSSGAESLSFELFVRRRAAQEPALARVLDEFGDGFSAVSASVRDLLDAGFQPEHRESLEELSLSLRQSGSGDASVERLDSLLDVASGVFDDLESKKLCHGSGLFSRAADLIARSGEKFFPSRRVWVYGVSDATGVVMDLLESILRMPGSVLLADQPLVPGTLYEDGGPYAFTRDLLARLHHLGLPESLPVENVEADIRLLSASGSDGEVFALAQEIRALIDSGEPPERIGVVSRAPQSYRVAVRRHFRRLGIPFSGVGLSAPLGGKQRSVRALLALLMKREGLSVSRWMAARSDYGSSETGRGKTLLYEAGVGRLLDVHGVPEQVIKKEPKLGIWMDRAKELIEGLLSQPEESDFEGFRHWLESFTHQYLGWPLPDEAESGFLPLIAETGTDLDRLGLLSREEFLLVLDRCASGFGEEPVGGNGGGVQFLDVMEARSRTFDHLFIVGLNRGVFPRVIQEDALLPESLRGRIKSVLPDMPMKGKGFDEEPYLFAQLLAAAPRVTLSWQTLDDLGKSATPSAFIDSLLIHKPGLKVHDSGASGSSGSCDLERVLPAFEYALRHALNFRREGLAPRLALAMAEQYQSFGWESDGVDFGAVSRSRVQILAEQDPDWRNAEESARFDDLGPYLGLIGSVDRGSMQSEQDFYVTILERFSGCPWQVFVERLLDSGLVEDPSRRLPGLDRRILGNVVHDVLTEIAREQGAPAYGELGAEASSGGVTVLFPKPEDLERMARKQSARHWATAFPGYPELAALVLNQALLYLGEARRLDWGDANPALEVIGTEMKAQSQVIDNQGKSREIRFRVDRVHSKDGALILTDYKTGRSFSTARGEATRRKHFLSAVRKGKALQAIAYARSDPSFNTEGRYLFLDAELDEACRDWSVSSEDEDLEKIYEEAMRLIIEGWDSGFFLPRLVEPGTDKEPSRCDYCGVAEACVRGDSGTRGRIMRWVEKAQLDDAIAKGPLKSYLDLWHLGLDKEEG